MRGWFADTWRWQTLAKRCVRTTCKPRDGQNEQSQAGREDTAILGPAFGNRRNRRFRAWAPVSSSRERRARVTGPVTRAFSSVGIPQERPRELDPDEVSRMVRMHAVFDPDVFARLAVAREHRVPQIDELQVRPRRDIGADHAIGLA